MLFYKHNENFEVEEMDTAFLATTPLFRGSTPEEIGPMLVCLHGREKHFSKGELIFRAGTVIHELGVVLAGVVSIESDDLWGNKTILDQVRAGRVFAETYACMPGEALMVNVVAMEPTDILLLDVGNILQPCAKACAYHTLLIRNLLAISAQKNLNLSRRSFHTAPKTIRGRLLSFLSYQALTQGRRDFRIPFDRQQLADYLNVDRSALSAELGKMQREGLLTVEKNHFVVSAQLAE